MDYSEYDKVRRSAVPLQLDVVEAYAAGRLSRREFIQRGDGPRAVDGLRSAWSSRRAAGAASAAPRAWARHGRQRRRHRGGSAASAAASAVAGGTIRVACQRAGGPLDPVAMQ